jgi:hypothetical protein
VGKQARGKIPDSGFSKKLARLFIKNLVKLVNLAPALAEARARQGEDGPIDVRPTDISRAAVE